MSNYQPLRGIQGIQINQNGFHFRWEPGNYGDTTNFFWIYKEDELNMPQKRSYSECLDHQIQAYFQNIMIPFQEIRKVRFLIFMSDSGYSLSQNDIQEMSRHPEFLCEVYCGNANVEWTWVQNNGSTSLWIRSDKKLPQGLLYYEYTYGTVKFRFTIPGEVQMGENRFDNIFFPLLEGYPKLQTSAPYNVMLQEYQRRTGPHWGFRRH
ncbi:MAG: hypothetical protein Q4B26_10595 [Eubacteriales bacterium]|nr:hypothetical protein [Eubacteriales bacterium]